MNGIILRRIVWKEYRQIRSFWLALFALGTLLQVLPPMFEFIPPDSLLRVGCVIGTLFAVGCAGTIFAREYEDGTFDYLRMLPSAGRKVFAGKLLLAVVATLLLMAALFAVASVVTTVSSQARGRGLTDLDKFTDFRMHGEFVRMWGVAVVEAIAWGTFFSLILRRPLQAALCGITAACLSAQILMSIASPARAMFEGGYSSASPFRLALAVVVLLIDVRLAKFWLRGTTVDWSLRADPKVVRAALPDVISQWTPASYGVATKMGRLVWQEFREARFMIAGMCATSLVLGYLLATGAAEDFRKQVTICGLVLFSALMGVMVFRVDQRRCQFRFFTDRGVRPGQIWLSRQFVSFGVLLVWTAVALGGLLWNLRGYVHRPEVSYAPAFLCVVLFIAQSYAAGQYASVFIRSDIMSGLAGIVLAAVLLSWWMLCSQLTLPIWWSVLPIVLVLIGASWARTGDLLTENRSWRARFKALAIVSVPLAVILIAIPPYRVLEVPQKTPSNIPSPIYLRIMPASNGTVSYHKAAELFVPRNPDLPNDEHDNDTLSASKARFLETNAACLQQLLTAANEEQATLGGFDLHQKANELFELLLLSARERAADGQIEQAWLRYQAALELVRYLDRDARQIEFPGNRSNETGVLTAIQQWAASPGQTSERLKAAAEQLAKNERRNWRPQDYVARNYLLVKSALAGDSDAQELVDDQGALNRSPAWLWAACFWERSRAERVVDEVVASDMDALAMLDDLISSGMPATPWVRMTMSWDYQSSSPGWDALNLRYNYSYDWNDFGWYYVGVDREFAPVIYRDMARVKRDHEEAVRHLLATPMFGRGFYSAAAGYGAPHLKTVMQFRATEVLLMLQAWKLEHRQLPTSLDELSGPGGTPLPLDPYSGRPFGYSPVPMEFTVNEAVSLEHSIKLPKGAFIWSIGRASGALDPRQLSGTDAEKLQKQILESTWFEVPGAQ